MKQIRNIFKVLMALEIHYYNPITMKYNYAGRAIALVYNFIFTIILFTIVISYTIKLHTKDGNSTITPITKSQSQPDTKDITSLNLKQYILELNFKFPDIVWAQAILESKFKSDVYKRHNNLFGMKKPSKKRMTTSDPERNDIYAHYENWKESVLDRALYDCRFMYSFNRTEYMNYLQTVWAEDPKYSEKIDEIASSFYISN